MVRRFLYWWYWHKVKRHTRRMRRYTRWMNTVLIPFLEKYKKENH